MILEKHHIIFRSQLGMDFKLNYIYLSAEDHRGNNSPHMNRNVDLKYKRELESNLRGLLVATRYTEEELIQLLGLDEKQSQKAFKRLQKISEGMCKEEIIKRLLGGRYYL